MANTREYMDYLDEQISIAPANSQEEYAAAETIASIFSEHGLRTSIEDFDSHPWGTTAPSLIYCALFGFLLVAGLVDGVARIALLVVCMLASALMLVSHFVAPGLFDGFGPGAQSQNVVGIHRATGDKVVKGARPIVIVAHYDTPRTSVLRQKPLARFQASLHRAVVPCVIIVLITIVLGLLPIPSDFVRTFAWIIGLMVLVPVVVLSVLTVASRFESCTLGSNDNKSSVAAMLSILNKVDPAEDRVQGMVEHGEDRPLSWRAGDESVAPNPRYVEVYEEVKGVRHGEQVLAALGILPASCEIIYEDPRPRVVEEGVDLPSWDQANDPGFGVAPARQGGFVDQETPLPDDDAQYVAYDRYAQEEDDYDADQRYSYYDNRREFEADDTYEEDEEYENQQPSGTDRMVEPDEVSESYVPEPAGPSEHEEPEDSEEFADVEDEEDYEEDYDEEDFGDEDEFDDEESVTASVVAWFKDRTTGVRDLISRIRSSNEGEDEYEDDFEDEPEEDEEQNEQVEAEEEYEGDVEEDEEESDDDLEDDEDDEDDLEDDEDEEYEDEDEFEYYEDDEYVEDDEEEETVEPEEPESDEAYDEELPEQEDGEGPEEEAAEQEDVAPEVDADEADDEPEQPEEENRFVSVAELSYEDADDDIDDEDLEDDEDEYEDLYEEDDEYDSDEYDVDEEEFEDDEEPEEDEWEDDFGFEDDEEFEGEYEDEFEEEDEFEAEDGDEEEYYEEDLEPQPTLGGRIAGFIRRLRGEESEDYYYDEKEEEPEDTYEDAYEDADEEAEGDDDLEEAWAEAWGEPDEEDEDEYYELDDEELDFDAELDEEDAESIPDEPERPADPNLLHFDRVEDADILERDTTGLDTMSDSYELYTTGAKPPSRREKPEPVEDPAWGVSSYAPARPAMSISRRAALFDLPDPSAETVDPLSEDTYDAYGEYEAYDAYDDQDDYDDYDEYQDELDESDSYEAQDDDAAAEVPEADEDVPVPSYTDRVARPTSSPADTGSFWGGGSRGPWKGGATMRSDLRDDAEASTAAADADDLQQAILELGDDYLVAHDIWFVATGASEVNHAGIRAFVEEHQKDLRGAFLVNLDSIGAGTLSVLVSEGLKAPRRADRRLVRMIANIAHDLHMQVDNAMYTWDEREAATAMRSRIRSVTIAGLDDNDLPAYSHTMDDIPRNVDPRQVSKVVRIVTELIRRA